MKKKKKKKKKEKEIQDDFMKAVRKVADVKKLETKLDYSNKI